MDPGFITLIVVAVVILIALAFFFYFVPVGLWITALFSGVRVGMGTLIGMRLRKVRPAISSGRSSAPPRPGWTSMSVRWRRTTWRVATSAGSSRR